MKNAFCTFVYGDYYRFLPYYLLAIRKHYPETSVIVLYDKMLPVKIKSCLQEYRNVIVMEQMVETSEWLKHLNHRGAARQSLRHLLHLNVFENYDCIYFGDVDILHLRETKSLFEFHLIQAEKHALPFSNKVRPLLNDNSISSGRLTGLHFVKVKPYFEKMTPVIDKFISNKSYRDLILEGTERNEHVLFNLCKAAFSFDPKDLLQNERPWHGFHLGLVRGKDFLNIQTINDNSSLSFDDLKEQLTELNNTDQISKLLLKFQCKEVYNTYRFFGIKLPISVKLKYQLNSIKVQVIKFMKQVNSRVRHA